jgi:hypothetical protein
LDNRAKNADGRVGHLKISKDLPGIESGTSCLEAQCLNQLGHPEAVKSHEFEVPAALYNLKYGP